MFFWKTAKETVPERPIRISSVEWRDGQQSLLATRIRTQDMLPILPKMDEVGYECMEMWGGATFDVAIRYLGDDPWERVREFKKLCKKTPLRMLLRGQNLIGYKQYPDDVVEKFVELAAKAGIDKFLVFDGLNDVRNTETAIKAVLKNGKTAEANICYTISPVHTLEKYVQMAKDYAPFVRKIEVEVENLDMVKEAVEAGADIIMLDNMSYDEMKEALLIIDGRAETECSGNVTKENIEKLSGLGVDYISSGALTHSAPILDVSLKGLHVI